MMNGMPLTNWLGFLVVILSVLQYASTRTRCSVTFYWTEKGQDRIEKMRNYGLLEEKLMKRKYKELKEFFNPKNVYAYTVEGDCCWKIYGECSQKNSDSLLPWNRSKIMPNGDPTWQFYRRWATLK